MEKEIAEPVKNKADKNAAGEVIVDIQHLSKSFGYEIKEYLFM